MGNFIFFAEHDGKGRQIGSTLKDSAKKDLNLEHEHSWDNDDIKSITFEGIAKGTIIELWDRAQNRGDGTDDWMRIEFLNNNISDTLNVEGVKREEDSTDSSGNFTYFNSPL